MTAKRDVIHVRSLLIGLAIGVSATVMVNYVQVKYDPVVSQTVTSKNNNADNIPQVAGESSAGASASKNDDDIGYVVFMRQCLAIRDKGGKEDILDYLSRVEKKNTNDYTLQAIISTERANALPRGADRLLSRRRSVEMHHKSALRIFQMRMQAILDYAEELDSVESPLAADGYLEGVRLFHRSYDAVYSTEGDSFAQCQQMYVTCVAKAIECDALERLNDEGVLPFAFKTIHEISPAQARVITMREFPSSSPQLISLWCKSSRNSNVLTEDDKRAIDRVELLDKTRADKVKETFLEFIAK